MSHATKMTEHNYSCKLVEQIKRSLEHILLGGTGQNVISVWLILKILNYPTSILNKTVEGRIDHYNSVYTLSSVTNPVVVLASTTGYA